jgi:hypothetical protein
MQLPSHDTNYHIYYRLTFPAKGWGALRATEDPSKQRAAESSISPAEAHGPGLFEDSQSPVGVGGGHMRARFYSEAQATNPILNWVMIYERNTMMV